jgi:hypothetical protein
VLPVGATETGTWAFNATTADTNVVAPISFPIRVQGGLEESEVHFQGETGFTDNCKGSATNPQALAGNLCIYTGIGQPENATLEFISDPASIGIGAGDAGALLHFSVTGVAHGSGSWAVTK